MKSYPVIFATLALAITSAFAGWTDNYSKALEQAAEENKLVLLNFTGSDWCPVCIQLDKDVFSTPAFKQFAAKNLILVEVDFPQGKELPSNVEKQNNALQRKFKVPGFPTLVLLDSTGKELARNIGYLDGGPTAFINWVKNAQK